MSYKDLNIKQLQDAAKDFNSLNAFEPPLNEEETNANKLVKEITDNASELVASDHLSDETKAILNLLEVGPWFVSNEDAPEVSDIVEEVTEKEETKEKPVVKKEIKEAINKVAGVIKKAVTRDSEKVEPPKKIKKVKKEKALVVKKERYTRIMAFAEALREGGKNDADLIAKAGKLYNQKSAKKAGAKPASPKVASEIHMYAMGALKALNLIREKDGKITVK